MPRVVIAGWIGSTNLGDELILRALVERLQRLGTTPVAISVAPEDTASLHGCEAVPARPGPLLGALRSAELLVFGGGGLVQDRTSPFNLPYHLARVVLARTAGVPVVGVGLGAAELTRTGSRAIVRTAWPETAPATARDEASARVLRGLGIETTTTADLALSLTPPSGPGDREDEIAVCLRPWSGGSLRPASRSWTEGLRGPVVDATLESLRALQGRTGARLRFVSFQPDRDGPLHEHLAGQLGGAVEVTDATLSQVFDTIRRARLVVAARYHAQLVAAMVGRPVVALGYTEKVRSLAAELGHAATGLPWSVDGLAGLADAGTAHYERGAGPELTRAVRELQSRELGNERLLRAALGLAS